MKKRTLFDITFLAFNMILLIHTDSEDAGGSSCILPPQPEARLLPGDELSCRNDAAIRGCRGRILVSDLISQLKSSKNDGKLMSFCCHICFYRYNVI